MEEISSLDSFPTDGESLTQNEIMSKPDDKNVEHPTTSNKQNSEIEMSTDTEKISDENPGGNNNDDDDDFEQISEGTFDVDDFSQSTSTGQPAEESVKDLIETNLETLEKDNEHQDVQLTQHEDEINELNAVYDDINPIQQDNIAHTEEIEKDDNTGEQTIEETANESIEHEDQQVARHESENFEEVDANVSTQTTASEQTDEKNMLGEADNTLQLEEAEETEDNQSKEHEDEEIEGMDVDESENQIAQQESTLATQANEDAGSLDDVEMASPVDAVGKDADTNTMEEEHLDETIDTSFELHSTKATEDGEKKENNSAETVESRDVVDDAGNDAGDVESNKTDDISEKNGEREVEQTGGDEQRNTNTQPDTEANIADEDDAEQDDEPVENVQEPEESDVCLIPDDTETQMTDAEKEQAILAREEAEKANEEAELAEKAEKAAAAADKQAEIMEEVEEAADREPTSPQAESEKDAAAQADDKVGADATATDDNNETTTVTTATSAELPDPDEPLLEEMHPSAVGDAALAKIIIAWTVTKKQHCKQCSEEKMCGFRFKNIENPEQFDYLCGQQCCESLIAANPGKFFIRRKKFLLDEVNLDEISEDATQYCIQCKETKTCKYYFKQDDENFYICNDDCYNLLNVEEPDKYKLKRHSIRVRNIGTTNVATGTSSLPAKPKTGSSSAESRVINRTAAEAEAARLERVASFQRRCADCFKEVTVGERNLLWETMDFCNEICLGKYQRTIGANCQTCHGEVPNQALGKYCVRFGFDIRQFCCAACLNEFKKGLKTCSCCQKDISSGNEGFLAPVGDKEQFKDFCSQACMRRYDSMCNPKKKMRNDICAVCNNDKPVRVEIILDDTEHTFCSNPCFSAFKFVSNIVADQCGMCTKYFERKGTEAYTVYTEHRVKVFCSRVCLNVYIIVNRRIVSCQWCKVKKYNFDMIYKKQDTQEILMCSLNCLTLYGVSLNAFSRTTTCCDNCSKLATPQYHLTMSDASMRNFCTYQCVMQFQNQFARAPLTLESDAVAAQQKVPALTNIQGDGGSNSSKNNAPFPTGLPKRVKLKQHQQQPGMKIKLPGPKNMNASKKGPTVPVISAVSSLASGETETMIGNVSVRRGGVRVRKMDSSPPPLASPGAQTAGSAANVNFPRGRPRKSMADYRQRSPTPPQSSNPQSIGNLSRSARPRKSMPDYRQDTPSPPVSMSPPPSLTLNSNNSARSNLSTSSKKSNSTAQTETKIVTVPPYPPTVRNVQTSCRPQTVTVGFQTVPQTIDIGVQTTKDYSNKVLIPVPVPIFIPQPMYMYSAPFPVPVPIPLPIPVPIFVPTTRNSAQGILKEIKKIQDKMPTDPLEAELLMMAEMVADDKTNSDSDSEDEVKPDPAVVNMHYNNNLAQQHQPQQEQQQTQQLEVSNNAYGEDMLQMALKMATGEYDQPTMDLESAMTANTITNPPPGLVVATHDDGMGHMNVHHLQQVGHQIIDSQRGRGRKRGSITSPVSPRNSRSPVKRARLQDLDAQSQQSQLIHSPVQMIPKPDANMCLKYTFGVNAWKQWVVSKNADIEKSSIRRRTFKTELLQMTADELNYSLCLFVKEVRKPNGTEYAPDTIYYLVLGIQQYLYENGRIDNIFTDPYYERFTDCLDEVARRFSVLYNDSQYIVTRVEEEHLWECKQLGAHSPHVLLSTLMFFNTKHFNLTTVEEHMQLSFSHIMKHWKRTAQNAKVPGTRNVLLRFYPPQAGLDANPRKKKVYEQQENEENPLRCPVRLYEFYLSKCPESVKTRNDVFYLQPERSCVPDSPVWYSTQALSKEALQKMLQRVKMVKEINIALLTS